jgi:uncharacterized damage-inducible protein DinB
LTATLIFWDMSNVRSSDVSEMVPRAWPESEAGDELRLLWGFLNFLRATAVNKAAGLSQEDAAAAPFPESPFMSVLGVLSHLTAVERWWASIVGGGRDLPELWESGDVNAEFRLAKEKTPAEVVEAYRAEWAISEESLAGMAAGDLAKREVENEPRTVRWILGHLVQETARHVGHLDVLREFADGQIGE